MPTLDRIRVNSVDYDLVGSGELLPVGTEIDIASTATIPSGWEEVSTKDVLLAEVLNSSANADDTNNKWTYTYQDLDVSEYEYIYSRVKFDNGSFMTFFGNSGTYNVEEFLENKLNNYTFVLYNRWFKWDNDTIFSSGINFSNYSDINKEVTINLFLIDNTHLPSQLSDEHFTLQLLGRKSVTKRIKKVSQTTPASLLEVYDEQERVIGTYNGQPLYRKVVNLGVLPNATTLVVAHNISNLKDIIKLCGVVKNSTGYYKPVPFVQSGEAGSAELPTLAKNQYQLFATSTDIRIYTGVDASAYSGIVVVEYTKTTDTLS